MGPSGDDGPSDFPPNDNLMWIMLLQMSYLLFWGSLLALLPQPVVDLCLLPAAVVLPDQDHHLLFHQHHMVIIKIRPIFIMILMTIKIITILMKT